MVFEDSFGAQSALQDFLSLIMRHWNVIADTLHSGEVFLPLLLDENGISHANDWARGFLRGMELRRTDWAVLLDDEKHGGWLVPIFALAHEHHPDSEMRPYKRAISAEEREKLIVDAQTKLNHSATPDAEEASDYCRTFIYPVVAKWSSPLACAHTFTSCCGN